MRLVSSACSIQNSSLPPGPQDRTPKASIPLHYVNVTMNGPGLDDHANSMLIAFKDEKSGKTRNIFVYAENGKVINYYGIYDSVWMLE